jgi:hypothetical protein
MAAGPSRRSSFHSGISGLFRSVDVGRAGKPSASRIFLHIQAPGSSKSRARQNKVYDATNHRLVRNTASKIQREGLRCAQPTATPNIA